MAGNAASRHPVDIALLGATGFAGGLTADYLASHLPRTARWALAGRSASKLEAVAARLAADYPEAPVPVLVHADVDDAGSLRVLAASARVVITTVGPYLEHGEPLVAACAAAGTDYVDLTGEPEFVDRMYLAHHSTAVTTGARLVHACGFDSVPHDLGALFTVKQLPAGGAVQLRGVLRGDAGLSGGTLQSGLGQLSRLRALRRTAAQRRAAEPRPEARRIRSVSGRPRWDAELGTWLLPLPTIDPVVVSRSAAARDDYGPDFTYAHYAGVQRVATLAGALLGFAALLGAVQVPPVRRMLSARIRQGEGPSEERRARSRFSVDFVGVSGGQRVHTRVSGGDPGYTETAKMLAESALSLAFDDNPTLAGQVTTATAMGENLTRRLIEAGMEFRTVHPSVN